MSIPTRVFIGRIRVRVFGRIGRIKGVSIQSSR
jgi:hypothetical protein